MLNAAESAMDAAAEDDAERQRNRTTLYAPPRSARRQATSGARPRPAGPRMDLNAARALMSQVASEDARLTSRRSG
jgi:hypothetical protein